ncbi:MAG: hypothetical protein ACE5EY_07565, partial [Anaerolineae bacterium]
MNQIQFKRFFSVGILVLLVSCQPQSEDEYNLPVTKYLTSEATQALNLPFSDAVRVGNMLYRAPRAARWRRRVRSARTA